jgi:hypothetical protein
VLHDNLDIGRPDQISLIFDRRIIRTGRSKTPGRFRTRDGAAITVPVTVAFGSRDRGPTRRPAEAGRGRSTRQPIPSRLRANFPGRGVAAGVSAPIPRRGRRYLADLVGYRLT